jgi:hypothetical protein
METEGLITKHEKEFYLHKLTNGDESLLSLTWTYWKGEQDEIELALKLKQAFSKTERRTT